MTTRSTLAALAVAAAAILVTGSWLASDVTAQWNAPPAEGDAVTTSQTCREIAAELEIMSAELLALDETLTRCAQDMHAAATDDRLDALTRVTEELIDQRRATIEYLKGAHQKLIVHLIEHAMTGDREAARRALAECPVVKRMSATRVSGAASQR